MEVANRIDIREERNEVEEISQKRKHTLRYQIRTNR